MDILDMKLYLDDYLNDCMLRKRLSEKTIRAYRMDLKQFFDFISKSKHNQKTIQEYIYMLNQKYAKYKTVKRKIASIKAFYAYLEYEEIIEFSPFRKIRTKIQEPKILPKTIHKENLKKIFELLNQKYKDANTDFQRNQAIRNMTIVELLFSTGIRISELCHIKVSDIDFYEKTLKIYGKGSKERIVYLGNENIIELLKKNIEFNEKKEYLFYNRFHSILSEQSVRLILKGIEEELELDSHITPHMFRHTFATTLLEKEVDIRYIQNILGHSSISTTQIYTHVSYSKQREIMIEKNPMNDFEIVCYEND